VLRLSLLRLRPQLQLRPVPPVPVLELMNADEVAALQVQVLALMQV
jgi:hypothetical protein